VSPYLEALGLTLAIETPAYAAMLNAAFGVDLRRGIAAGLAVNVVTHPVAFLAVFPVASDLVGDGMALAGTELMVWGCEAVLLYRWLGRDLGTLALISFIANGLSLALGILLLS
jgi:hypothetical protein